MYLKTNVQIYIKILKIIKDLMILISHRGNIDKINTKEKISQLIFSMP